MNPVVRLGVLGWPVAHSRSPAMHNAALAAAGLDSWRYSLLPVPPELFVETVAALPARGFRGVNVTIPHKAAALALASDPSPAAREIGAANTLLFEPGGGVRAENTDAPGMIAAIGMPVAGRTALVLGAGGTARAAVWALREAGAARISVWNRTAQRARSLCDELGGTAIDTETARDLGADVLINCTAAGLAADEDGFKALPLDADAPLRFGLVVDFVYSREETPLLRVARRQGVAVVDGLELLVRQGALAFALFTGRAAPLELMRDAARGEGRR